MKFKLLVRQMALGFVSLSWFPVVVSTITCEKHLNPEFTPMVKGAIFKIIPECEGTSKN